MARVGNWIWRGVAVLATIVAVLLALRVVQSERQPALEPWHTWAPDELGAGEIDEADWATWIEAENSLFGAVDAHMREALDASQRVPANRYFEASPLHPGRFPQNWNRSYQLQPAGEVRGAVVLLHGLSDSPYSLRHVARRYADQGFVAVGIRLPAHGTVPAALTRVDWRDWRAATRLAVREARSLAGPGKPLHLVGYSNGAALAMQYTFDAAADTRLEAPARVVLFSPMIGLTRFARYAGMAGWPAILPPFSKSAWLEIVPEFNPFKYSSFPLHAGRESYELTQDLGRTLASLTATSQRSRLPPVLAFMSAVDSTVLGEAVFHELFAKLPANGSELVVFDVNRAAALDLLLSQATLGRVGQLLPTQPQDYRITVLGNTATDPRMTESSRPAGTTEVQTRSLDLEYPRVFFSLSHVALPFPPSDSLYGTDPDGEDFGIHLGNQAPRGEIGTLLRGADALVRASCNPFYPYVDARLVEVIGPE